MFVSLSSPHQMISFAQKHHGTNLNLLLIRWKCITDYVSTKTSDNLCGNNIYLKRKWKILILYNLLDVTKYLLDFCLLLVMMNNIVDIFSVVPWKHCAKGFLQKRSQTALYYEWDWYNNIYVNRVLHYIISLLGHSLVTEFCKLLLAN